MVQKKNCAITGILPQYYLNVNCSFEKAEKRQCVNNLLTRVTNLSEIK